MRFHESVPVDECNDHFNALSGGDFSPQVLSELSFIILTLMPIMCVRWVLSVGWGGAGSGFMERRTITMMK